MDGFAGEQLERIQRGVGIAHLEEQSARLHGNRLLFPLVILEREGVTCVDVQRLSAVPTVDEREMLFVSPRFIDSKYGGYPRRLGHTNTPKKRRSMLIVHRLDVSSGVQRFKLGEVASSRPRTMRQTPSR
jgi:hypothetical protein